MLLSYQKNSGSAMEMTRTACHDSPQYLEYSCHLLDDGKLEMFHSLHRRACSHWCSGESP
jgi:hypothetical protein